MGSPVSIEGVRIAGDSLCVYVSGIATSANQATQITAEQSIVTNTANIVSALGAGIAVSNFPASFSVSNFPATQPVSGAFFQETQPVSVSSLPLPSGAATEATLAELALAQQAPSAGAVGPLVLGAVNESVQNYLDGVLAPLSLTSDGRLRTTTIPAPTHIDFFSVNLFSKQSDLYATNPNPWSI